MEGEYQYNQLTRYRKYICSEDAAASSIYGSRAPFGVILITTKSGNKEGKVVVNYNNSFRFNVISFEAST